MRKTTNHLHFLFLAYISLFIFGFSDNVRGPIFPDFLAEYGLSNTKGSWFFSVSSIFSFFGGYLCQFLLHHRGRIETLQVSLFLLAASQFGIWWSPTFAWTLVFCVVFGLSLGLLGVVQNVLVITSSPPQQLQRWQAGLHSMYAASSILAPFLVSFVYHWTPSWRIPFLAAGGLAGIMSFSLFGVKDGGGNLADTGEHTESARHREQIFFAFILAFYVAIEIMVSSRIALISRKEFSYSVDEANLINGLFFVGLFLGRVLFIFWRPPVSLKSQMLTSISCSILLVLVGLYVHPAGLALAGLAMAPFYPLSMTATGKLFPKSLNSVASYCVALSGITVVLMHLFVGRISDEMGLRVAMLVGPVLALVAAVQIIFFHRLFGRRIP